MNDQHTALINQYTFFSSQVGNPQVAALLCVAAAITDSKIVQEIVGLLGDRMATVSPPVQSSPRR